MKISQGKYGKVIDIAEKNFRKRVFDVSTSFLSEKIAHRILKKIPQLQLVSFLNQVVDFYTIDGEINLSVLFPIDIQGIKPNKLLVNQTTETGRLFFTIKGKGLSYGLKINLFKKDENDIEWNQVNVKVENIFGNKMEVSVDIDTLRKYYYSHNELGISRIYLSLRISNFFKNQPNKKIELFDSIEVNNDLSILTIDTERGRGGDEIVLHQYLRQIDKRINKRKMVRSR